MKDKCGLFGQTISPYLSTTALRWPKLCFRAARWKDLDGPAGTGRRIWEGLGRSASAGSAPLERATFLVRVSAPDAVALVGLHGELQAGFLDRTAPADRFRLRLTRLALELRFAILGSEEQQVVVLTTSSILLPLELL